MSASVEQFFRSTQMHRVIVLLCCISLIGNVGVWITGVAIAASRSGGGFTGVILCLSAFSSFTCAIYLLRLLRKGVSAGIRPLK